MIDLIGRIKAIFASLVGADTKIGTNTDAAGTTTVFARLRQIVDTYLASATVGLSALKDLLAAIADYIDTEIASILADTAELKTSKGRQLFIMDFWSDPQEEVAVTNAAGDKTLPTVTVADLPAGATIVRAVAMFKFRMVENTNAAANKLNGSTNPGVSQVVQVADDTPGTYYDAIDFVDDQFGLAAETREGGDVLVGSVNIAGSGKVDANDGYLFRWLQARADQPNLNFNDVQCGLRIWYSV